MRTFTVGGRAGLVFLSLCFLAAGVGRADATPRTWNNPAGGNWSEANNWLPVGTPVDGDDLTFPSNAGNVTTTCDLSGVTLGLLTVDGTYTVDGSAGTQITAGVLDGTGILTKAGEFVLVLQNAGGFGGSVTIDDGEIVAAPGAFGAVGDGTTVNAPGKLRYHAAGNEPKALILNGSGAVVLVSDAPAAVQLDGPITLLSTSGFSAGSSPREIVSANTIAGPSGIVIENELTFVIGGPVGTFPSVSFTGTGAAYLRLGAGDVLPGSVEIDLPTNATFDLNNFNAQIAKLTGTGTVQFGNVDATLTVSASANHAFNGTMTGAGHLHKAGSAELTLGGDNSYLFDTIVFAGALRVTHANALGPMGTTEVSGTQVVGNATLIFDNVAPAGEFTRLLPMGSDVPTLSVLGPTPVTMNGEVMLAAGSRVNGGGDITLVNRLSTVGGVTFENVTVRLGFAPNVMAGLHTLNAGAVLEMQVTNAITDNRPFQLNGGTLALAGRSLRVGALNGTGTVSLGTNGQIDVAAPNGSPSVYNGTITGTGTLRKSSTGNLTLGGATSFTGAVNVVAGRLFVAHAQALTSQNVTVSMFATLIASVPLTLSGAVSLTGYGQNNASQALQVDSDVTISGPTTIGLAGMHALLATSRTLTFQGAVSGPSLFATGDGTVLFNATGNTLDEIDIGQALTETATTLRLGVSNALKPTVFIRFTTPSTFDVNGVTQQIGAIDGKGTVAIGAGALSIGFAGPGSGMAVEFKTTGTGSLTLTGGTINLVRHIPHTFSGTLTVNGSFYADSVEMPATVVVNGTGTETVTLLGGVVFGPLTVNGSQRITVGLTTGGGIVTLGGFTVPSASTTLTLNVMFAQVPLKVNGPVSLGCVLDPQLVHTTFTPGVPRLLIDNDESDPIAGTFASVPEGGILATPFGEMVASYVAGTGNDFAIVQLNTTYQLSEGATGGFFDTELLIANPEEVGVPVDVTLLSETGAAKTIRYDLAARSRLTILVDEIEGFENTAFSTIVKPVGPSHLIVERTMRWDASGYGGHTEKATEGPELGWYFAEGAQGYFQTFLLLSNPQDQVNLARVHYMREGAGPIVRDYELAPRSRRTVFAGDDPDLVNQSFGMSVQFSKPGVAERAMYFGDNPLWLGGHESIGSTFNSNDWFFAEGTTGAGFDTYILVTNAGVEANDVTLTFYPESGQPVSMTRTMPGFSRLTVNPATENLGLPPGPFATRVQAGYALVAERSQYWSLGGPSWIEAHNSFGVRQGALRWGLAEGRVGGPEEYQTYILLANTTEFLVNATLTFLGDGVMPAPATKTVAIPPQSRVNVAVESPAPAGSPATTFGVVLRSDSWPIVVERSMYWNANGQVWAAGTNATATRLPYP